MHFAYATYPIRLFYIMKRKRIGSTDLPFGVNPNKPRNLFAN